MLDAIELERLGVPAANIFTHLFAGSVRGLCQAQGMPEYPSAQMPHPLAGLDAAGLGQRAAALARDVIGILQEGRRPGT